MTTIACDGKSIAGDGQRDHRGTICERNAIKVRRLNDGSLIGTSGDVAFGERVIDWLNNGCPDPAPELKTDGGFSALILRPDGKLQIIGPECKPGVVEMPFAVGSGMDFAISAMECGKTPSQAVEIAAKRDPHTGGQITVLFLEQSLKAVA